MALYLFAEDSKFIVPNTSDVTLESRPYKLTATKCKEISLILNYTYAQSNQAKHHVSKSDGRSSFLA
jgi:hypothetical protein